jgi:hypothetical protein
MNGRSDDSQLTFATRQGRLLLTANTRDFAQIHRAWMSDGKVHGGVMFIPQQRYSTGEIVRRLLRAAATRKEWASGLYCLSNF